ncbi:MAG: DUF2905 domain-containing protein [bacterium]
MWSNTGYLFIIAGAVFILIGVLILSGGLSWFGQLPGDIHIEGENYDIYFPLGTSLLLSLILTVLMYLLGR